MKSNRLEELTQNYEALINRKNEILRGSIQNVAWTKCRTKYVKPLVHR